MAFDPEDIPHPPSVWAFQVDEWHIWAGRTARDNDKLSVKVARNEDWWFHVRGTPGSHVVLFVRDGVEPPKHVVQRAAAIAAYHSKQRSGGLVAVSATRGKFVSKPRGAKPGTVQIRRESVIKVRPELPEG